MQDEYTSFLCKLICVQSGIAKYIKMSIIAVRISIEFPARAISMGKGILINAFRKKAAW